MNMRIPLAHMAAGVTDLWHQSKKLQIQCQTVNVALCLLVED